MNLEDIFHSDPVPSEDHAEMRILWVLRLLCRTSAKSRYLGKGQPSDALHAFLGTLDHAFETRKTGEIVRFLENKLAVLEERNPTIQEPLKENLARLREVLGLTGVEIDVLALRAIYRTDEILVELLNKDGGWTDSRLVRTLAIALGRETGEIRSALSPGGALLSSGLARIDPCITHFFNKFALIAGLPNALLRENGSLAELISFAAQRAKPPTLTIADFPHVKDDIGLLVAYLQRALESRTVGANVLLYGQPGIGKSELVRVISLAIGVDMYEVSMTNCHGDPLAPAERFAAYRLNQNLFARQGKQLILFDEIEDVLPDVVSQDADNKRRAGLDKGWTNRLLETNPVPALWVANKVRHIDPAYLRRFDYILHLRNPTRSVRKKILERSLTDLPADTSWVAAQAEDANLTPAFVARAANVLKLAKVGNPETLSRHFERMAAQHQEARGQLGGRARYPKPANYRLEYVNASVDVAALCKRVAAKPRGQLLLYGPPGSGKTAFAHFLGDFLDMPVVLRRASDLLSPWLGETEQNLMRMFQEAATDGALLVLDEADSFLQDRLRAVRSWEVTQVNELLTQIEAFQGLFICATNFPESLDSAALRRFSMKIRFDYLTPGQRFALFQEFLQNDKPCFSDPEERARLCLALSRLDNLTAGDFVTAARRADFMDKSPAIDTLLNALTEESNLKLLKSGRGIGFVL